MTTVQVKMETRFYVECPGCATEHDVDIYEYDEIVCECGCTFEYDNRDPVRAEAV